MKCLKGFFAQFTKSQPPVVSSTKTDTNASAAGLQAPSVKWGRVGPYESFQSSSNVSPKPLSESPSSLLAQLEDSLYAATEAVTTLYGLKLTTISSASGKQMTAVSTVVLQGCLSRCGLIAEFLNGIIASSSKENSTPSVLERYLAIMTPSVPEERAISTPSDSRKLSRASKRTKNFTSSSTKTRRVSSQR